MKHEIWHSVKLWLHIAKHFGRVNVEIVEMNKAMRVVLLKNDSSIFEDGKALWFVEGLTINFWNDISESGFL